MYKTLHKITRILSSLSLIVALTLGPLLSLAMPQQVQAAYEECSNKGVIITSGNLGDAALYEEGELSSITISMNVSNLETGSYRATIFNSNDIFGGSDIQNSSVFVVDSSTSTADVTFTASGAFNINAVNEGFDVDYKYIHLYKKGLTGLYSGPSYCYLGFYGISNQLPTCTEPIKITQLRDTDGDPNTAPIECVANSGQSCIDSSNKTTISASGLVGRDGQPYSGRVTIAYQGLTVTGSPFSSSFATSAPGKLEVTRELDQGDYAILLRDGVGEDFRGPCQANFTVTGRCNVGDSCSSNFNPNTPPASSGSTTYELCLQIGDNLSDLRTKCTECNKDGGVWTAVGCIQSKPKPIVERFIQIGLGLGGGVCLITCLAGGFMITTSQGEPKKINDAKEMITNALIGLLFIIFSVTILQFIGVTILNIPGFGAPPSP